MPSHHPVRPGSRTTAVSVVIAATAIALAGRTAAHAEATPTPGTPVKYFIVPPDQNGPDETLYEIAKDTLGDGDRYPEIFNLNKGREMPEGDRLIDPTSIEPGLVLVLPPDASGRGVRFGPLPAQALASDAAPASSTTRRPSPPPASPAPTTQAPATAPAARSPESGSGHRVVLVAGGTGALVLLAGGTAFLVRRRRGRGRAGAAAESDDAPVTAWSLSAWPGPAMDRHRADGGGRDPRAPVR